MHLVDDHGEPYVTLFSVQYTPRYSDYQGGPMTPYSNSRGIRKAAMAYSFSLSHMAASLPWPMSRMRYRHRLRSDGRSFRPMGMLSNFPAITMMPR